MTEAVIAASQKKGRKAQKRSEPLREAITQVVSEYDRMTVRQLYYQMEMRGYVGKTEADYDKVQYHCLQMRRCGEIPHRKITDSSRERREAPLSNDMATALADMHEYYRRDYWTAQPVHVEIWCEKDALSGVILPVCRKFGVTFVAVRGFDSESLAYESAGDMREIGKPTRIFYFGDHDPSGWWIAHNLQANLQAFGADATVEHMAVHPWQVAQWRLPTRRAKSGDTRLGGFVARFGSDSCTELDAIPPNALQGMVRRAIESQIDAESWHAMKRMEQLERETLQSLASIGRGLQPGETVKLTDGSARSNYEGIAYP